MDWFVSLSKKHGQEPLSPLAFWLHIALCVFLVGMAGLMSGLTLGLMSLDEVDLEVLKRSGTEDEKRYAGRIMRVIKNQHLLLVTLLLCNALANEALPIFLDRLADPITAVVLSVSVVLLFGEIIPQAVCTRYGLQVGSNSAWLVEVLMVMSYPIAAPIAKLLDVMLGGEHTALMRRAQLKVLMGLHSKEEGLGGTLDPDEISIIQGALDLTNKTAWTAMTPLDKVFMLDQDQVVDEALLQQLLNSGHSRIPVYKEGNRQDLVGLILVKELVLVDPAEGVTIGQLQLRALPGLSADTPLYMLLKLFESGGSHMAVLTKPNLGTAASMKKMKSGVFRAGDTTYWVEAPVTATKRRVGPDTDEEWGAGDTGDPVGIITIEDVIEELLQQEIIDETDQYMDNEQSMLVDQGQLSRSLPAYLKQVYVKQFTPRVGRLGQQQSYIGRGRGHPGILGHTSLLLQDPSWQPVHASQQQQQSRSQPNLRSLGQGADRPAGRQLLSSHPRVPRQQPARQQQARAVHFAGLHEPSDLEAPLLSKSNK